VAAATVLGARMLVPIHYGISGIEAYVEVADPLGELRKAARGRSFPVQAIPPGDWLEWSQ
jgi:L-ascorbate metabolism protein UlaG (beta-lactamase superfamily)